MAEKAKFRRGQVVMIRSGQRFVVRPIKIKAIEHNVMVVGDVIYTGTDNSCFEEHELRPQTSREIGPRPRARRRKK